MEPLHKPHLHHADPQQNASAESIERTNRNDSRRIVAIEAGEHANADGHTDWRRDGERKTEQQLAQQTAWDHGDAGAEREAFEDLVEEDDNEEGDEAGVSGHDERDADYC